MAKVRYETPTMRPVAMDVGKPIMAGSVTDYSIKIASVEVEDYGYGFSDDGGITDKGFEVTFE